MVLIRKELNFRDLGGYPTADGRHVRKGLFYRSGGLFRMSEQELDEIRALNVRYIMDLRADWQRKRKPDPEIPGAQQIEHTGYVPEAAMRIDFSPAGMHQTGDEAKEQFDKLELYYKEIIFGNLDFRLFLNCVAEGKVPIIFHCASGKDRTGAAAILLLLALGVDEETVMEDYILSNEYYEETINQVFMQMYEEALKDDYLPSLLWIENGVMEFFGRSMLEEIHKQYDSIDEFLSAEYGLDAEKLRKMRDMYTE
ncbi:MAG: tyrosine-protein phosphatase [Solobacterium sp.]|nr:tyrosine-protein phosphatase [Solobacterium sp.]